VTAQGWYQDPFGVHEQRWFSDGAPTSLVRDGAVEADDAPPSPAYDGPLTEVAVSADGDDMLRAGERPPAQPNYVRAAYDAATQAGWNFN
jgi:hypothetical protein